MEKIHKWVSSKKLYVLSLIDNGEKTEKEILKFYNISKEELDSWRNLKNKFGKQALRTTHIKRYR